MYPSSGHCSLLLLLACMATLTYGIAGPVPIASLEHLDPTLPPVLPGQIPTCSLVVLRQDFADTVGSPPASANYTQPRDCPFPWTRVVLELSLSASDLQKDRVAAIWIDGAEVLRTATPRPMAPGAFWHVRKDITRYAALLRRVASGSGGGAISMILENSNVVLPGVFSANVSLHFYRGALSRPSPRRLAAGLAAHPSIRGLYHEPADLILPISNPHGYCRSGFWLRINNETHLESTSITIPKNTYRAVLEIFVSYHDDDEFWYFNPLRSAYLHQPPSNLSIPRANGGFRQVYATIDGRFVGGHIPFAVLYPSSINPYFWSPVAAIGAFDMPSYDLDLTPFLGFMLDGRPHDIGLGVRDAQPYWLLSANLHLWVDAWSDSVEGALVRYKVPPFRLSRQADWKDSEGKSEIEGQVIIRFSGWVSSSRGNITTNMRHKIKFKSHIEAEGKGEATNVEMENRARTNIRVQRDDVVIGRVLVETEAPLNMMTMSSNGGGGSRFHKTKLSHMLQETRSVEENKMASFSTIADRQESEGSVLMQEGVAMWGSGDTKSTYKFRDDKACYLRTVNMVGGKVKEDEETASCAAIASCLVI